MCVYIYIYMCVRACMHAHTYIGIYVCVYMCLKDTDVCLINIYIYIYAYIYIEICLRCWALPALPTELTYFVPTLTRANARVLR